MNALVPYNIIRTPFCHHCIALRESHPSGKCIPLTMRIADFKNNSNHPILIALNKKNVFLQLQAEFVYSACMN